MAEIVDLNARRPLPKANDMLGTFDTIHEWVKNEHVRGYAVVVISNEGNLVPSYYTANEVDFIALEPFVQIFMPSE